MKISIVTLIKKLFISNTPPNKRPNYTRLTLGNQETPGDR